MGNARIRPISLQDVDNIMKWVNDPEVIKNFQNFDLKITREQEIAYLEKMVTSNSDRVFAIEAEDGTYLGNVGLHGISSKNRLGRLALIIGNQAYRGQGYGQSAVCAVLKYAFEERNFNKVWLMAFQENERARHIYEKAGFHIEGVLREEYADRSGKFHDMVRMSILRNEYYAAKQSA